MKRIYFFLLIGWLCGACSPSGQSTKPVETDMLPPPPPPPLPSLTPERNGPPPTFVPSPTPLPAQQELEVINHIGGCCGPSVLLTEGFISANGPEFALFDDQDPNNLVRTGYLLFPEHIQDVAVNGRYAYVVLNMHPTLYVVDLVDRFQPAIVAQLDGFHIPEDVDVNGRLAFIADSYADSGIHIIDITQPLAPTRLSEVELLGNALDVDVEDTALWGYEATSWLGEGGGIRIFEITNPKEPIETQFFPEDDGVADHMMHFFEPSPVEASIPLSVTWHDLLWNRNMTTMTVADIIYAFIANDHVELGGLYMIDITNSAMPELISVLAMPGEAKDVAINGRYAFIASAETGLTIVDLADIYNPEIVSTLAADNAQHIQIENNIVYIASGDDYHIEGIHIIDVNDPTQPESLSFHPFSAFKLANNTTYWQFAAADGILYLPDGQSGVLGEHGGGFQIVDVTIPVKPAVITFHKLPDGGAAQIKVVDDTAYVWTASNLHMFDITDKTAPIAIATYPSTWTVSMIGGEVAGDDIVLFGGRCNSGDCAGEVRLLTTVEDKTLKLSGWFDTPGAVWGITAVNNTLYVFDQDAGIYVLDTSTTAPHHK